MSDPGNYLWLIPALPLLAAAVIAAFGKAFLKEQSHWPCVAGAVGACLFAVLTLFAVARGFPPHEGVETSARFIESYYTWFSVGDVNVPVALRADGLTAIMLVMITFIGTLIAIFSAGYMHHDPGYPRFFAAFSLFLFFMTGLVLANNFIVLYACWEGVGLCSYLLIGFWFTRPSAAAAARKAFLVTRLGDIGLFLGILTLWAYFGHALDYDTLFANVLLAERAGTLDHGLLLTACLLLFVGAAGKSAQFPLHVWLPDAMEGPTPVSALIHAATMVTAGVYLVARCYPLFALAPLALLVVGCIGAITALLAALIALTQTDLKRVMAYSTLSQLGLMFLALGCGLTSGSHYLAAFAVSAAIFHLFTHAFFKALLFLASGSVMHAMGDVIDMRRFSGLRKVLPITHWTFLCGAGALSGFPFLFSGFWSKDEIMAVALEASHLDFYPFVYLLLFIAGLTTAFLTAFYTARAYFLTFWGELRVPPEAYAPHGAAHHGHDHDHPIHAPGPQAPLTPAVGLRADTPRGTDAETQSLITESDPHKVHESPPIMAWPLMILAVGAVVVGPLLGPTGFFAHFLEDHWMNVAFPRAVLPAVAEGHHINWLAMGLSIVLALSGIGLAYLFYVAQPALADRAARTATAAYEASRNRFYIDELYYAFIVGPLETLAQVLRVFDQYVIDGLVDMIGQLPAFVGYLFRPIQNGLVQFYALLMILGVAGFLLSVLLR